MTTRAELFMFRKVQKERDALAARLAEAERLLAEVFELADSGNDMTGEAATVEIAAFLGRKLYWQTADSATEPTSVTPASADNCRDSADQPNEVCIACGKPWDGQKCGQADNGHPFAVCTPVAAPQPSDALDALRELTELMQGVIDGTYTPDSFTLQPARAVLQAADQQTADQPAAARFKCGCTFRIEDARCPTHNSRIADQQTADQPGAAHVHTDECWEPDSGRDMGRNEEFVRRADQQSARPCCKDAPAWMAVVSCYGDCPRLKD